MDVNSYEYICYTHNQRRVKDPGALCIKLQKMKTGDARKLRVDVSLRRAYNLKHFLGAAYESAPFTLPAFVREQDNG